MTWPRRCRLALAASKEVRGEAAAGRTLAPGRARACDSVAGIFYQTQEDFIVADRQWPSTDAREAEGRGCRTPFQKKKE
jgi:hypothetical protein